MYIGRDGERAERASEWESFACASEASACEAVLPLSFVSAGKARWIRRSYSCASSSCASVVCATNASASVNSLTRVRALTILPCQAKIDRLIEC